MPLPAPPSRPALPAQPAGRPEPLPCPACTAPLPGTPARCPACGLRLRGPEAVRLWQVDLELAALGTRADALRSERGTLLIALRAPAPEPDVAVDLGVEPDGRGRAEWGLPRVQGALLALGALLLGTAAAVFAVVSYDRLGLLGQALVLLAVTVAAGAAVPRLLRAGLAGTADAISAVAVALLVLDVYAARRAGVAGLDAVDATTYWALATGALALVVGAAVPRLPGLRVPVVAAVALAQLPALVTAERLADRPVAVGLLLAGQAGLDLLALVALTARARPAATTAPRLAPRAVTVAGVALSALTALVALDLLVDTGLSGGSPVGGALLLSVLAALALAAVPQGPTAAARERLAALPVLLAAVALGGLVVAAPRGGATAPALAPLLAALGWLAVVAGGWGLRGHGRPGLRGWRGTDWWRGVVVGGLAVVAVAVALLAPHVAAAVAGPLTWPDAAWSLAPGAGARAALAPGAAWQGDLAVVGGLLLAAAAVAAAGTRAAPGSWPTRRAPLLAGALALAAAVTLPVALDPPFPLALALLLGTGGALLAAGSARGTAVLGVGRATLPAGALLSAGAGLVVLAASWSSAARAASLVVLPVAAALVAAASATARPRITGPLAGLAGLLAGAALGATGSAAGLAAPRVGGLLLVAVAALLATGRVPALGRDRAAAADGAAALLAAVAVALAADDVGWLAWTLAGSGLLALAVALRPDRRRVALAGGLLLAASTWVRLADAGVTAPEPYVVPVALAALALGHRRRRTAPGLGSWPAYGPGLAAALLPSLAAALDDPGLTRPLLLGAAALGVALLGARARLATPLVLGGGVLAAVALRQLAPLASAVPRWSALAVAGTLLVVVGATYEQRRRDLARLRDAYRTLG